MPIASRAKKPGERGRWLIAALSARALAQAARRARHLVVALDLFADADTRDATLHAERIAARSGLSFDPEALLAAAARWPDLGLVYGSGFEDAPDLLAGLAAGRELAGNPPGLVAGIKDPWRLAALLDRLGIPHPETGDRPADGTGWLLKRIGASGGGHIRPADGATAPVGWYVQRAAEGRPVSALFLADGRACHIVGFTEQWTSPAAGSPFRFGGALGPVTPPFAHDLEQAVTAVVAATGLRGLNTADFLLRADGFTLLEINPRPGAAIDLFARSELFDQHVAACRGQLPATRTDPAGMLRDTIHALAIVYAERTVMPPAHLVWPPWTADRPPPGTLVEVGAPLCTVLADAITPGVARALAMERVALVTTWMKGTVP